MNLVVLGAGKVGETLVETFIKEKHDISVIDSNGKIVSSIINKYDVKGVFGSGVNRQTLLDAGTNKADFFIACTSQDEVNIVCCVIAKKLGAKHTVARIRDPEFYKERKNIQNDFSIDMTFNPEHRTAREIARNLKFPSAKHVESFAGGNATMMEFSVSEDNPIIGKAVMDVVKEYESKVIFAMVNRNDKVYIPRGDFIIENGDQISVIAKDTEMTNFCKKLHIFKMPAKSAFIIGGGKVGYYVANELLFAGIDVKIIEQNEERCVELNKMLPNATVLLGDGSDSEVLREESLSRADACIALTGFDEENAMISLYAKQSGVNKVITKINRPSVQDMANVLGLDSVISPKDVIANHILRYVRSFQSALGEGVNRLYKLDDSVEALEFNVGTGVSENVPLKDMKVKKDILIGGIVRDGEYVLPTGDTCFKSGDIVIVVAPARKISSFTEIFR